MNTRRYREVRAAVLKALESGNYRHETRAGRADEKNLLQVNLVDEVFVINAIRSFPPGKARRSGHHFLDDVDVWTLNPTVDEGSGVARVWYIKFYCLAEDDAWFLSVHPSRAEAEVSPKGSSPREGELPQ
jgi:hypothetical protein